jgi:hypothetical protein
MVMLTIQAKTQGIVHSITEAHSLKPPMTECWSFWGLQPDSLLAHAQNRGPEASDGLNCSKASKAREIAPLFHCLEAPAPACAPRPTGAIYEAAPDATRRHQAPFSSQAPTQAPLFASGRGIQELIDWHSRHFSDFRKVVCFSGHTPL